MRKTMGLIVLAIIAAALIAGGSWRILRTAPSRGITPARPTLKLPDDIQMHLGQVTLYGLSGGKIVWKIRADNFDLDKIRPVFRITGVKDISVVNDGKKSLSVMAGALERNTITGDIAMTDKVTLTGDRLTLRADEVAWQARQEMLKIPRGLFAQVGDFQLDVLGDTAFNIKTGNIRCDGGIIVSTQGNTLRAGNALVNIATQNVKLGGEVTGEFDVEDLAAWAEGKNIPTIPEIPAAVRKRYEEHQKAQQPKPGAP